MHRKTEVSTTVDCRQNYCYLEQQKILKFIFGHVELAHQILQLGSVNNVTSVYYSVSALIWINEYFIDFKLSGYSVVFFVALLIN